MRRSRTVLIIGITAALTACTSAPDDSRDTEPSDAATVPLDLPTPTLDSADRTVGESTQVPEASGSSPDPSSSASPSQSSTGSSTESADTSSSSPSSPPDRTVAVTSPANGADVHGPVVVEVEVSGFALAGLTGNMDDDVGHLYAFVDEAPPPDRVRLPASQSIVTSADTDIELGNLSPGEHTVTVVATHGYPVPFEPRVDDTVTFTVRD